MNQKLIEQLRNGEIAVINDGTLEQLREVLGKAFTETDITTHGYYKYYTAWSDRAIKTYCPYDEIDLPKVSVKDFYQTEETKQDKIARLKKELELLEKEFEVGDVVAVLNTGFQINSHLSKGYLAKIKSIGKVETYPYEYVMQFYCGNVGGLDKNNFHKYIRHATTEEIKIFEAPKEITVDGITYIQKL